MNKLENRHFYPPVFKDFCLSIIVSRDTVGALGYHLCNEITGRQHKKWEKVAFVQLKKCLHLFKIIIL